MKLGTRIIVAIIITVGILAFALSTAFGCDYNNNCPSYFSIITWIFGFGFMLTKDLVLYAPWKIIVPSIINVVGWTIILSLFSKD